MRNLKIPLILFALVGLIALAGCGGDDDTSSTTSTEASSTTDSTATESTSTTTEATTKGGSGDYAQQVTSIITDSQASFTKLGSDLLSGPGSADEAASAISDFESQIDTTIDDLNALDVPPEAQEGQEQVVAAFEALSPALADLSDAASSNDEDAAISAAQDLQGAITSFQADLTKGLQAIAKAGIPLGAGAGG